MKKTKIINGVIEVYTWSRSKTHYMVWRGQICHNFDNLESSLNNSMLKWKTVSKNKNGLTTASYVLKYCLNYKIIYVMQNYILTFYVIFGFVPKDLLNRAVYLLCCSSWNPGTKQKSLGYYYSLLLYSVYFRAIYFCR